MGAFVWPYLKFYKEKIYLKRHSFEKTMNKLAQKNLWRFFCVQTLKKEKLYYHEVGTYNFEKAYPLHFKVKHKSENLLM